MDLLAQIAINGILLGGLYAMMALGLALVWGVHAVVTDDARYERDMADRACRHAYIDGFAQTGERVIIVAVVPFGTPGATNNMRIALIGPEGGSA